jgi:hypothetical protein
MPTENNTVFNPDKTHKQNLPPYQHKVCAPIWNVSHIVSTLLHCGLQRNDQYRTRNQRLPAPQSPSVESSAWGTASSVSESDGVSDGVGSWQTLLFDLFEGLRTAFDAKPSGFGFSGLLDFLYLSYLKIFFHV